MPNTEPYEPTPYERIEQTERDPYYDAWPDDATACSCAWCRGFEPWRSDFAQCIQHGWAPVWEAIANGSATEIMRIVTPSGEFVRWAQG